MSGIDSPQRVSALLVGDYLSERRLVYGVFEKCGWELLEAKSRRCALDTLLRNRVQVVIAESQLPSWNWQQVLQDLQRLEKPPELVVTSRTADEHLWAEVLNVGAYDVLAQPLDREEVERVVAAACRHFDSPTRYTDSSATAVRHA